MAEADRPAASLQDVSVEYPSPAGPVVALRNVTLELPRGSSTAILGRSGAGKSTLVAVLALLRAPTAGEVRIGDIGATDLDPVERARLRAAEIGIVFQAFHLEASFTAIENVMLPWYFADGAEPRRAARDRAHGLLELLGIGELAQRRPNEMSGGQRQRVAIARALFPGPSLFIADEPTGNLDEETAGAVAETLLALPERLGTTVLVVTHDRMVADQADRRITLVRGRLDTGEEEAR
jgi:ABC-type lipoprotein export system ATPase subunit